MRTTHCAGLNMSPSAKRPSPCHRSASTTMAILQSSSLSPLATTPLNSLLRWAIALTRLPLWRKRKQSSAGTAPKYRTPSLSPSVRKPARLPVTGKPLISDRGSFTISSIRDNVPSFTNKKNPQVEPHLQNLDTEMKVQVLDVRLFSYLAYPTRQSTTRLSRIQHATTHRNTGKQHLFQLPR